MSSTETPTDSHERKSIPRHSIELEKLNLERREDFERTILGQARNDLGLSLHDIKPVMDAIKYAIYNNPYDNNKTTIQDQNGIIKDESKLYWEALYTNLRMMQEIDTSVKILHRTSEKDLRIKELYRSACSFIFTNTDFFDQINKEEMLMFFSSFGL